MSVSVSTILHILFIRFIFPFSIYFDFTSFSVLVVGSGVTLMVLCIVLRPRRNAGTLFYTILKDKVGGNPPALPPPPYTFTVSSYRRTTAHSTRFSEELRQDDFTSDHQFPVWIIYFHVNQFVAIDWVLGIVVANLGFLKALIWVPASRVWPATSRME
ncbi:hypothetical protein Hanom_Chr12g01158151 [Helianthus anomalus]